LTHNREAQNGCYYHHHQQSSRNTRCMRRELVSPTSSNWLLLVHTHGHTVLERRWSAPQVKRPGIHALSSSEEQGDTRVVILHSAFVRPRCTTFRKHHLVLVDMANSKRGRARTCVLCVNNAYYPILLPLCVCSWSLALFSRRRPTYLLLYYYYYSHDHARPSDPLPLVSDGHIR
jgi:hypothetical protein